MLVNKKWRHFGLIFLLIYCFSVINLYLHQFETLKQAEVYFTAGNAYEGMFALGQCLRSRPPVLGYTETCYQLAQQKMTEFPQLRDYIDGYQQSTAHFNEAAPALTFLLHLSFIAFVILLLYQLLAAGASKQSACWRVGFIMLAFITWLWCGYAIR